MATLKKRVSFFDSDEGLAIKQVLVRMVSDNTYHTASSYSANSVLYPDNLMPFVDKHMAYLNTHPTINPRQYLANLRLMTRLG